MMEQLQIRVCQQGWQRCGAADSSTPDGIKEAGVHLDGTYIEPEATLLIVHANLFM